MTTLSKLVLITRSDGVQLGFTDYPDPITYAGVTFEPTDGATMSAIQQTAGSGVDNAEIDGLVMSSTRITDVDVSVGKYDGATFEILLVNRNSLADGAVTLLSGVLGEFTVGNGAYKVEARSLTQLIKQYVGDCTTSQCQVRRLGDAQCKLNLAAYTFAVTIIASASFNQLNLVFNGTQATGYFTNGLILATSGENAGLTAEIKNSGLYFGNQQFCALRLPFPYQVNVGDTFSVTAGCDRLQNTCTTKFNNIVNFRGQPYLPGNIRMAAIGR